MAGREILCPFSGNPCTCGQADVVVRETAYLAFRAPQDPFSFQAAVDSTVQKAISVHNKWAIKSKAKTVADNNALLAPNMASRCPYYQA